MTLSKKQLWRKLLGFIRTQFNIGRNAKYVYLRWNDSKNNMEFKYLLHALPNQKSRRLIRTKNSEPLQGLSQLGLLPSWQWLAVQLTHKGMPTFQVPFIEVVVWPHAHWEETLIWMWPNISFHKYGEIAVDHH